MDNNPEWPFDQEPNVAALTTRQVLDEGLPVLLVTHYADDHSWAFVCGTTDDYERDGRLICMAEVLKVDESLKEIADLPPGWCAWREDEHAEWNQYEEEAE